MTEEEEREKRVKKLDRTQRGRGKFCFTEDWRGCRLAYIHEIEATVLALLGLVDPGTWAEGMNMNMYRETDKVRPETTNFESHDTGVV
jgi:hypothetical protein